MSYYHNHYCPIGALLLDASGWGKMLPSTSSTSPMCIGAVGSRIRQMLLDSLSDARGPSEHVPRPAVAVSRAAATPRDPTRDIHDHQGGPIHTIPTSILHLSLIYFALPFAWTRSWVQSTSGFNDIWWFYFRVILWIKGDKLVLKQAKTFLHPGLSSNVLSRAMCEVCPQSPFFEKHWLVFVQRRWISLGSSLVWHKRQWSQQTEWRWGRRL